MKRQVNITVSGSAGTGKSTIMRIIEDALSAQGMYPTIDWGIDGRPPAAHDVDRLRNLREAIFKDGMELVLTERQAPTRSSIDK